MSLGLRPVADAPRSFLRGGEQFHVVAEAIRIEAIRRGEEQSVPQHRQVVPRLRGENFLPRLRHACKAKVTGREMCIELERG